MFRETARTTRSDGHQAAEVVEWTVPGIRGTPCSLRTGDLLYVEGDDGRGVFIVKSGRVKLSTSLPDGKLVIVYIAEAGAVLGLNGVMGQCEYEVTAEALEPTFAEFIKAGDVRTLLRTDPEFSFRVAEEMARRYRSAHSLVCTLAQSDPILVKLARLVHDWLSDREQEEAKLENVFTHQQIAEMIGTTRETVNRAFRYMRECGILTLKGHLLEVHDIQKLRSLAGACDMPHRL